jgi:hypothetical protein
VAQLVRRDALRQRLLAAFLQQLVGARRTTVG